MELLRYLGGLYSKQNKDKLRDDPKCEAILPRCTVGSRQAEHESQGSRWKRTIW